MIRSYNQQCSGGALADQGNHELQSQDNRICIRREAGMSKIEYVGNPRFEVGLVADAADAAGKSAVTTGAALNDAVGGCNNAEGTVTINDVNIHCGEILAPNGGQTATAPVIQDGAPFTPTHQSNAI